jgi:hypothetical protein
MILVAIFLGTLFVTGGLTHLPVLGVVLGVVVTGSYWVHDVKRHPKVACRVCGGSGDKVSRIGGGPFRRPRGACGHCGGKKGFPRPGLAIIDPAGRRKILDEIVRAKESRKN